MATQYTTSQPTRSFVLDATGLTQGFVIDHPVNNFTFESGTLAADQYSAVGTFGACPAKLLATNSPLGASVTPNPATFEAYDSIGWIVNNRVYHGVITTGGVAPVLQAGETCVFVRTGSGAKLVVKIDPTFASAVIAGTAVTTGGYSVANNQVESTVGSLAVKIVSISLTGNMVYDSVTKKMVDVPVAVIEV